MQSILIFLLISISGLTYGQEVDDDVSNYTIDSRIVGGRLARTGQFPHQIVLRRDGRPNCGGTIISQNYVISAAHCVTENNNTVSAQRLSVRAGSIRLNNGGEIANVSQVKVHPQYRFPVNDIALLRMARPFRFNNLIRALPPARSHVNPGTRVTVSGFGAIRTGGTMSTRLRYVEQLALSDEECYRRVPNDPSIFCLISQPGRGICQGDSGGPAIANGRLLGAMSFTLGACGTSQPDGFARIAHFQAWIAQNTQ